MVSKLFNIVQPDVALFGTKDYQQLAVVRRMVADLNMPMEVVGMPIIREADGLALSSRNAYLSPAERQAALCLSRSIREAREIYRAGERDVATMRGRVAAIIAAEPSATVDYIEFRHGDSLEEVAVADDRTLLALAVKIGRTRLIDNCLMGEE